MVSRLAREFATDIRYGARLLRRSPGFTFVAAVSLALGIGGATSVFAIVNAVVLRTLPVARPEELFAIQIVSPRGAGSLLSGPLFAHARDELAGRADLFAATSIVGMQMQPDGSGAPERGTVQLVSGEYFQALHEPPQFGRLLTPADNVTVGAHAVAVVSDVYWRTRLGGSPDAIGRTVAINGTAFTVIGVTRPEFFGTTVAVRAPDAWIPAMMQPVVRYASNASSSGGSDRRKPWPPQPQISWLNAFARVPDGTTPEAVASALTVIVRRDALADLPRDADDDDRKGAQDLRAQLTSAARGVSQLRQDTTQPLVVLLVMVGVLLAIACGNVAGLLLARATGREREVAIRYSIGALRGRIVRQMIAESLLLGTGAGAVGVCVALWARDALLKLFVPGATRIDLDTGLDARVLLFALGVSLLTGLACGIIPAIRSTRVSLAESLKDQARGTYGGRRGLRIGRGLVAAQMAFCLLLLVIAALFARTLQTLAQTDVGFDRQHVLTARLDVRGAGYGETERRALYQRLIDRLQAIPGVESASLSANGPLANSSRISSLSVEGYTPAKGEQIRTNEEFVTDRYFATVGLRLLEGRLFGPQDRLPAAKNSIINRTMAKRFFGAQSPIGKRWTYGGSIDANAFNIIGVVEDARYVDIRESPPNMVYQLFDAAPDEVLGDLEVRASGPPRALIPVVRQALTETEARLPIVEIVPLSDRLSRGLSQERLVASLTSAFGALALLLAALGLYGTISYGISRRHAELGLRMALGADRSAVLWMVMREAFTLVIAGAAAGLVLSYLAGRAVGALLYGVAPADPLSFAAGALVLTAVAAVAAFLPAQRASRIEPMAALSRT